MPEMHEAEARTLDRWSPGLDLILGSKVWQRPKPDAMQRVQNGCRQGKGATGDDR
jgi:hypothetical protein